MDCVNCGTDVPEDVASLTLSVFLCPDCGAAATLFRKRVLAGLENVMARLDDEVRSVILREGQLTPEMVESCSPEDALLFLLAIKRHDACEATPSATTKPPAITVAGSGRSEPRKAAD